MKIKTGFIIGALLLSNQVVAKADPDFIAFALKQANTKGFYGCNAAIKHTFRMAGGSDIRVISDWFKETKSDALKLTGIYGSKGDTVYLEAEYRIKNNKCYASDTATVTFNKSCSAYISENKSFDFVAETGDYIIMKNKGGNNIFLKPLNSACIVTFKDSYTF